jgi:hypothetical protein
MKSMLSACAFAALLACPQAQAAPSYLPFGVQTDVPLATVLAGGWSPCYQAAMVQPIGIAGEQVLGACTGEFILMAGRATGADTFLSLAAALRGEAIVNTGQTSDTHLANGARWWFSPDWSWGFTAADDTVENDECDTTDSPTSLCLHTIAGVGGYRINNLLELNDSVDFEKVFFQAGRLTGLPEPASMLLLGAAMLGAAGASRRRRPH